MQLFYNPHLTVNTAEVVFDKLESGHIVKVLRKRIGDILHITNGTGVMFKAQIHAADAKKCTASIIEVNTIKKPWPYKLHMAVAPTKSNDRFEWFLEKATEIGVDEITPIFCDRSERKVIKQERLEKIIHAACKQSLKYHFPKINKAVSFSDFIRIERAGSCLLAHCDNSPRSPLKSILENESIYTVLIGPEGDFSRREIEQSLQRKYIPVSLGASRLRTETAAIVAVHSIAYSNQ